MKPSDGIGSRIAQYRRIAGLSARELAEQAGRNLTRGVIANIESGRKTDITVDQMLAIAAVLGVPPMSIALPVDSPMRYVDLTDGSAPISAPVWVLGEWFRDEPVGQVILRTPASTVARTTTRMINDYRERMADVVWKRGTPDEVQQAARDLRLRADELAAAGVDVTIERSDGTTARIEELQPNDLHRSWRRQAPGSEDG